MNVSIGVLLKGLDTLLCYDHLPKKFLIRSVCDRLESRVFFAEEFSGSVTEPEVVFKEAIELVYSVMNHPALHADLKVPIWTKFLIGSETNHSKDDQSPKDDLLFCVSQLTHTLEDVIIAMEEAMPTKLYSLRSGVGIDEEIVVGFDEETTILADRLTGGINKQLEMISIVGMPGLGKTTLARKVYNHPFIVHRFHIRAWSCISQVYNKRDILIAILSCVIQLTDDEYYDEMSSDKLAEMLYKCLKCKRYLVVLDDIWDQRAWDDLKISFPNDNNGSKIMLTSRLIDLNLDLRAQTATTTPNFHLRFLTQDESLVLLAMKVFQSGILPSCFRRIANKIAIKCQGLPLALVVISGLLKSKTATIRWWKHVAESASSYISSDMDQYMDTLALSYNHLPQRLRPLFLFLGVFPEDCVIPVRKLIWLWIAEGLIHQVGRKSLEEIAMDSFMELLKRSLVIIAETGFDGGIKTCRLHDLLRDLCLRKAEEEKFVPKVFCHGRGVLSFANSSSPSSSSIPSEIAHLSPHIPHSLFGTPLEAFKLLRVLDLESISILLFPCETVQLVHLRYLAIRAKDGSPPTSISNLLNLQTLVISSRSNITVPQSTWKLLNLRHLYIKSGENLVKDPCFEEVLTDDDCGPAELENLQTFSQVCPSSHCNDILARSPNLRKIGFCGPLISEVGNLTFPNLGFSDRLEALKLLNTNSYPKAVTSCNPCFFPEKLKRLTLSNTALDWKDMWTLGMLPNLEVLKLRFHACTGDEWETVDGGFCRLRYLKFQDLDIVQWKSSSEHFPSLQHFLVHRCPKLKEIPSGLGHIPTLELIEVNNCSDSAVCSAEEIKEEQEELGNDFLKVLITHAKILPRDSPLKRKRAR